MQRKRAYLALEDGAIFRGFILGKEGIASGELVFNTASCGYQEILTDPSYRGQIVCMAFPAIGNYGFRLDEGESNAATVSGFVVADASATAPSENLSAFLERASVVGIDGVDTRAIVRHIRDRGALRSVITSGSPDDAIRLAQGAASMAGSDLVTDLAQERTIVNPSGRIPVAVLDCGVKRGIIGSLVERDARVEIFPASSTAQEILDSHPAGVVLGNGPGDPAALPGIVGEVRGMIGKVPLFGICLGHQLLALAAGAQTYKLPFGHRGSNHPVLDMKTGAIAITSQNHGFAVDEKSLPGDVIPTERNLYDGTNEGIELKSSRAFSVQYHPEARPGPTEAMARFDRFFDWMRDAPAD